MVSFDGLLLVYAATALFAAGGFACIVRVVQLYVSELTDTLAEKLNERQGELKEQLEYVEGRIKELEERRSSLGGNCEVSEIDWCLDDNRWRRQDLEWEIRDTEWERDDRIHQKRTSKATFWTAFGATLVAVAGLVFSVGTKLIGV